MIMQGIGITKEVEIQLSLVKLCSIQKSNHVQKRVKMNLLST